MQHILVIKSSINGNVSISNQLIDNFIAQLQQKFANLTVTIRDLNQTPIPVLTPETSLAIREGQTNTPTQQQANDLANLLIEEIKKSDAIIMAVPRYNFHVPASLKAYVDYIARPRLTFAYNENGPVGLLPNVPVYAVVSSGGIYTLGDNDFMLPWLKQALSFLGLSSVNLINAQGVALGNNAATEVLHTANQQIAAIVASL